MNEPKLRSKFREAIGDDPMPSDLSSQARHALRRAATTPRPRFGWIPAAVAALLGIAVVASLLAVGEYRRSHAQPATTTPRAPAAIVYFQKAPVSGWQAIDWTGTLHGVVGSDHVGIPYQSPDGSRIEWSPQGVWQIVDTKGRVLSTPDLGGRAMTWADDSSGLCVLKPVKESPPNGGTYRLEFYSTAGGSRTVTSLTTQKGPNVAACSPEAGRVVITTASGYKDPSTELRRITFGELDVIDFNTGAVLLRQAFPIGNALTEVDSVSVSHDGSLAALGTQTQMTIVNLRTNQVVARAGDVTPLAFSWNGKLLVVVGSANRGQVLNASTAQIVWSDPATRVTQGAVPNPRGSEVMLFVTTGGLNDLLVVSADAKAIVVAADVFPDQIAPCSNCSAF